MNYYTVNLVDKRVNVSLTYLITAVSGDLAVERAKVQASRDAGLPLEVRDDVFSVSGVECTGKEVERWRGG